MKNGYWLCVPIVGMAFALGWCSRGDGIYKELAAEKKDGGGSRKCFTRRR